MQVPLYCCGCSAAEKSQKASPAWALWTEGILLSAGKGEAERGAAMGAGPHDPQHLDPRGPVGAVGPAACLGVLLSNRDQALRSIRHPSAGAWGLREGRKACLQESLLEVGFFAHAESRSVNWP